MVAHCFICHLNLMNNFFARKNLFFFAWKLFCLLLAVTYFPRVSACLRTDSFCFY
jgi:hypothetical protein